MGIDIILDLDEIYEVTQSKSKKTYRFTAPLKDGTTKNLIVYIDDKAHPMLPDVYNLAYGVDDEKIRDRDAIQPANVSRVFSTIFNCGIGFLKKNPDIFLGINGSDHKRSCLFHRVIDRNFDYLDKYFIIFGVKYYARLLQMHRPNSEKQEYWVDQTDMKTEPVLIKKNHPVDTDNLYNYFIFKLK